MTARALEARSLVQTLEASGFKFKIAGQRVLVWPESRLCADLLARLRAHKDEIRAELRRRESPDLAEGKVLEQVSKPVAWRLYSKTLARQLWLCRDRETRGEIAIEHPGIPVLLLSEIPLLRGKPVELLRAIVETKATFPDGELRA